MNTLPVPTLNGLRLTRMTLHPCTAQVQLTLSATGPPEGLVATCAFLHASWLQDSEDPAFLREILSLLDGHGVNLREEGQVIRRGGRAHLWSGMTYFDRTAEADLDFHDLCEVIRLNLQFLTLKRHWSDARTTPGAPRYQAEQGFRVRFGPPPTP